MIKILFFSLLIILTPAYLCFGQARPEEKPIEEQENIPVDIQARLEEMTENMEDEVTEDESYLQDIDFFNRHPINLNSTDRGTMERLHLLTPMQLDHFFEYRKLFGKLINIYEIQAIPEWDVITIRRILPFITISESDRQMSLRDRLRNGETMVITRYSRILERAEGYKRDGLDGRSFYPGSPDKLLLRYKYRSTAKLQYGFTAEKDAGEQFFAGHQKNGFDFYSAHFYVQDMGIVKTLAIGDFAVNFGQGLIQWQSLSFSGPGEALNIKRQSDKLRPYVSAGEVLFNRGVGITLQKRNWESTLFLSFRNMDASLDRDTIDFATSIRQSGFHRTLSEINGANVLNQLSWGANIQYAVNKFKVGLNTVQYYFNKPIYRGDQLYKKFISPGGQVSNYSIDYSWTYKAMHLFGESAMDDNQHFAFINGLGLSLNRYIDVALLHRLISKRYLSLYGDAFTEQTSPVNENGFYTGINIRPNDVLRIDAYADVFKFPWLRYRVDNPSTGSEYLIQLQYLPKRGTDFYIRYRVTNKAINTAISGHPLMVAENKTRQNLRAQTTLKVNDKFTFRTRAEHIWYDEKKGFMLYGDLLYKPMMSRLSGNIRLQYFETDDYDTRLYSFENDVLYSYSIPMVYGQGFRYYLNLRYNLIHGLSLWTRLAQTVYKDREEIGSGLDKTIGNKRTELKVELVWRF